jgi:hypothetical protein
LQAFTGVLRRSISMVGDSNAAYIAAAVGQQHRACGVLEVCYCVCQQLRTREVTPPVKLQSFSNTPTASIML